MRVLVAANMWPSAAAPIRGIFVREQVDALRARGLEVEVVALDDIPGRRRYLFAPARITLSARRFKPDVVHAHYGLTGVASRVPGAPLVVTFHGSDVFIRWQRAISRIAAELAFANICVSSAVRDALGIRGAVVIPCGVDTSLFRPLPQTEARRRLSVENGVRLILFAGARDNPIKGWELCAAALDAARRRSPPIPRHEVRALHAIPRADVPWWMAAADVLVMTSRHEGSPMVVKEALACGLPIVSVPVGDVVERLAGVPGCRIAARDPAAIARAIGEVLERPERYAPPPSVADITSGRIAERLEEVYRRVAGRAV